MDFGDSDIYLDLCQSVTDILIHSQPNHESQLDKNGSVSDVLILLETPTLDSWKEGKLVE